MAPRKKKTSDSTPGNTNDEAEQSQTPEILDPLGEDNPDDVEETPSSEDEESVTTTRELLQLLNEMRTELRQRDHIIENLHQGPPVIQSREPKVSEPPEFFGKVSEYGTFMSQCLLTFTLRPGSYSKDKQKVLFVISYLRGNARDWAKPILENEDHPYFEDFEAFKSTLDSLYIDRNLKHQARDKLFALKQTKSASAYAVEFQQIIVPLKLNDEGKCLLFYNGLKSTIKDALALVGEEEKFKDLVDQVINIDQRQFHRLKEEKKVSAPPKAPPKAPSKTPEPSSKPFNGQKRPATPGPSSGPPPKTHISFPRGPLSEEEKKRRRDNNLCVYCGDARHGTFDCPRRPAKAANAQSSQPTPEYFNPNYPPENWPSQATMRPVP